jgi:hypothetical protein
MVSTSSTSQTAGTSQEAKVDLGWHQVGLGTRELVCQLASLSSDLWLSTRDEKTCQLVPGFDLLLKGSTNLMGRHYHTRYQRLSWGFLSVDEVLTDQDPSVVNAETISDCILRMQSVYHSDQGGIPIIFDTSATIGVTPFASDF